MARRCSPRIWSAPTAPAGQAVLLGATVTVTHTASVIALGTAVLLAGGLILLLLAIGLGRTALGLAVIVAFSVGLAGVLVGLGLILVSGRTALERFRRPGNGALIRRLPLLSATVVTALGVTITAGGVSGLLG
ncbi:hypothetical protein [Streptomyces sp. NPDC093591]|uniref:hypothetical protein n=1 Tax=Streptomyces sp. NPDC093591 TaxID=3366044 RepID=UPI003807B8CC